MRKSSFGGRMLRRVAVIASSTLSVALMVPTAAPAGAAPASFTVGPGGCAGAVAWDAVPLVGPATPLGGSIGLITNGSTTVVDTGMPDPLIGLVYPGATLTVASSVTGIVVYPTSHLLTSAPLAKNSSIKFSVTTGATPTGYLGQARWASPNGFGGPKIDVGPMHLGLTPVGLPVAINDVFLVPGGGYGAMGVSAAAVGPPGTVAATYFAWQDTLGAGCSLGVLMCVIVPFNGLPPDPSCP